MQPLPIQLTDIQFARVLTAYGAALDLGRDATPDEVAGELTNILRDRTLAVETNIQVALVSTKVQPW